MKLVSVDDLRFAVRHLRKNPGFSAIAVLTLAICIGGSLAIFAVVDAVLIRPLPFRESDRLVVIHNAYPGAGIERGNASIANYFERRNAIDAFQSISMFTEVPYIVGEANSSLRVRSARVTPEFFRTLGVPLAMGREFTDQELDFQTHNVAIITDQFWRSDFNADPNVLGRTFVMQTFPITVVGVLPPGFRYLSSRAQIFRPFAHYRHRREAENRHSNDGQMIARLASNQTLAQAQAQLDILIQAQLAVDPNRTAIQETRHRARIIPLHEDEVGPVKSILLFMQAGVACLLLIGVVNVGGLALIRASGRIKEFAIRQSLGASMKQISAAILTESILLAFVGGALGVLFAIWGIQLVKQFGADAIPLAERTSFDARIAWLAVLASIAIGIITALPIFWTQLRGSTEFRLHSETRATTGELRGQRARHLLVVTQIAIAFVLLCAAGSLGVGLKQILNQSPGFEPEHVLSAEVMLPWEHYPANPSRVSFVRRLEDRLRGMPGVTQAAITTGLPFTPDASLLKSIFPENSVQGTGNDLKTHYFSSVTPGYWKAMNIPLQQGRLLEESDFAGARVAVIDQSLALQYWPDGDALGSRFSTSPYDLFDRKIFSQQTSQFDRDQAYTVIGIVGNVKRADLAETGKRGGVYVPYTDSLKFQLIIRSAGSAVTMAPAVEKLIRQIDPGLPLTDFKSLQDRIDDSLITRRSPLFLMGASGAVATFLAALGIYGALAYAVHLRRREVGVRMALGAMPHQIGSQFLSSALKLSLIGVLLGIVGAWATGRVMQATVFKVTSLHLPTVAVITLFMIFITILASLPSALRAARVSPTEAMKIE